MPRPFPARTACRTLGLATLLWLSPGWAAEVEIRNSAPAQYTVVEGDTLWDIAGKFLEEPWLWPEVWQINPQIENPDLIYPGDVIELAYVDGNPVLRLSRSNVPSDIRTVRLSPQVRREPVLGPIPAIPLDAISAYLRRDSILSAQDFENAPYVLGSREGRALLTVGDEALARGNWANGVALYDIVRDAGELKDPDTGDSLGIEMMLVATATLNRTDFDQGSFTITNSYQEVRPGDRLIPTRAQTLDATLLPAPPDFRVNAAIIGIQSGRHIAGTYDSLTLNIGANDGIRIGQLLTVQKVGDVIDDPYTKRSAWQKFKDAFTPGNEAAVTFAGEKVASVLVYRVFDEASFGLVLEIDRDVRVGDRVVRPD